MTTDELKATPTDELREFLGFAQEHSALSESTVRKDFPCDDAILAVSSHAGDPVEYAVEPYPLTLDEHGDEVENRSLLEDRRRAAE